MKIKYALTLVAFSLFLVGTAVAQSDSAKHQTPVDISSITNDKWCTYMGYDCTTFPVGIHSYNGVEFNIPGAATGNNAWFADTAAGGGSGTVSVTIPVNIANV